MKAAFPKITIVTPSYNQGKYLEQTILSVIEQNYPNLEYIIIDGGSTDDSANIIKKHEKHLTYWVSEKDNGLYHALDKGFAKATGEIMAWLNSDDMYHKTCLFSVAEMFSTYPQVNWIMGKNTFYNEQGASFQLAIDEYNEVWSKWRLLLDSRKFIQQESVFWRKELWQKAGGFINTDYQLAGDFELWFRFFEHAHLYTTNHLLSGFRFRNENQKSKDSLDKYYVEVNEIIAQQKEKSEVKTYLSYCRFIINLTRVIPFKKLKLKIKGRVLKLQPLVFYLPREGYVFKKFYRI